LSLSFPRNRTKLSEYKPSIWLIPNVDLEFSFSPKETKVISQFRILPNKDFLRKNEQMHPIDGSYDNLTEDLFLNGIDLLLDQVILDGEILNPSSYNLSAIGLTIPNLSFKEHQIQIQNRINPISNTELLGLYQSNGIYCTQNEPEGFRRITFFIDRPDILSIYKVKMIVDALECPYALSNGNRISTEDLSNGKKVITWHDPFPKPTYLFALVAGDLDKVVDTFITVSGKKIDLEIYCNKGLSSYCSFAMESLKYAMVWDEKSFGREYDLNLYMIVAVNDFNMGAMENKGLNIFNSKLVLASEETATDSVFEDILSVIAHEYFHNWTGNRITCRDWFQLTLKEGLTVFRDQLFSQDLLGAGVKRIDDVDFLRNFQFPEDNGPLSHPIQPKEYLDIDNFYTRTVYEKGAEVIRMGYTLLGRETFRKAMDLYFLKYDGMAVTTNEFLECLESASGRDLSVFRNWYDRSGTPVLQLEENYNSTTQAFELNWKDMNFSSSQLPLHFPISFSIYQDGRLQNKGIWEWIGESGKVNIGKFPQKPILSLLEDFSSPIILDWNQSEDELYFLWANSQSAFVRWDSGNKIKKNILDQFIEGNFIYQSRFLETYEKILDSVPSFPNEVRLISYLLEIPNLNHTTNLQLEYKILESKIAIEELRNQISQEHSSKFNSIYDSLVAKCKNSSDRLSGAGFRILKNTCLGFIQDEEKIFLQWETADNLTDEIASLKILSHSDTEYFEKIMNQFKTKWNHNPLVMDYWLSAQAGSEREDTLDRVMEILNSDYFDIKNPNRVGALLGNYSRNRIQFHREDGRGYEFIRDCICRLDEINPQSAARLSKNLGDLDHLPNRLRKKLKENIETILSRKNLSNLVFEVLDNII
jgi:aminopeptidase N